MKNNTSRVTLPLLKVENADEAVVDWLHCLHYRYYLPFAAPRFRS